MNFEYDIVSAGELLVDLLSQEFAENLDDISSFKRVAGGSPANLAMNMARLNNQVALVASVGKDDMGNYLMKHVEACGVDLAGLRRVELPSSLILVTRSKEVSSFEPYRFADKEIISSQFPKGGARIFHTTCFGLSQEPARSSIMAAAKSARKLGTQLSIDANYAQKIWPDQQAAQQVVEQYLSDGGLLKISEVDWERLYGNPVENPETVLDFFLSKGATIVCLTLGGEGLWVASSEERHLVKPREVEVKDTTGAGDAFWSGFLTAWLENRSLLKCAQAGRAMAELKLQHFGMLPKVVDRKVLDR